ncbi:hypothetical protein EG328_004516 [Venturia inaequalis]|uniref:Uncharacterized protein n=1 Tax=Venturia inaequalis TaxID=5025 RepID=A0A8H3ULV9_VENIN|nr:hypothetical protein EG328_004516 [Venturia inaequalis]
MSDSTKYTSKLHNSRILIFGGSSGIGYAAAEAVVENGAIVYISSSSQSRVDDAVSRIQKAYPSKKSNVKGIVCNLGSEDMEENIVVALKESTKEGKLDHVIHTAGDSLAMLPLKDLTLENVRKAGNVRFFSPLLLAKHLPTYLSPGPKSSLTLTTGGVAEKPIPNWSAVASYAGGLHSMTRNLALDLKPIRVNLVSPGAVDTELWKDMSKEQKEEMFSGIEKSVLTGRVGKPEDVAEQYLCLLRDYNVTGSVVHSDSGHALV